MHYECVRCHVIVPGNDPHLCADVKRRYERREKQVTAVCDLLWEHGVYMADSTPLAQAIVAALANMGVDRD
jgi:hypothetical protein